MSLPATITHTGSVGAAPSTGALGTPSLQEILNTSFQATYSSSKGGRPSIIGATDGSPFVLALETITRIRAIIVRVRAGSIKAVVTSPVGTDQVFRISDLWMLHVPAAGDELTAVKFVGTADLEYLIAGDTA